MLRGQVPKKRYLFIGDGKLSRHLSHYFSLLEISHKIWSRPKSTNTNQALQLPALELIQSSDVLLLAVSDRSIAKVIENFKPFNKPMIHFSGSLYFEECLGLHPLMTFSDQLYELDFYKKIPLICDCAPAMAKSLLPNLGNTFCEIAKDQKSYYHALCVISGNFTTLLWKKYFDEMKSRFSIDEECLRPYLQATMNNLLEDSKTSLTGPLARGDQAVIDEHKKTLQNDPFLSVYKGFEETYQKMNSLENTNKENNAVLKLGELHAPQ